MKAPSLVASEMAKDAAPGAGFSVGYGGLILFPASGANADKAIRRAAVRDAASEVERERAFIEDAPVDRWEVSPAARRPRMVCSSNISTQKQYLGSRGSPCRIVR
jgi:hypothetical protein